MKMIILISVALFLVGCAPDTYGPDDYGYHYTHTTPMGIMYRVDPGGASLDPTHLDVYFTSVMDCTGRAFSFDNLLIISTANDVHPDFDFVVEGWAWQPTDTNPAIIVINSTQMENGVRTVLAHELVHIFIGSDTHDDPLFRKCGLRFYD